MVVGLISSRDQVPPAHSDPLPIAIVELPIAETLISTVLTAHGSLVDV